MIDTIYDFFHRMYLIHEESFIDNIGDYFTYETVEEAYLIASNDVYPPGIYINEHNNNELFLKEKLDDGKYAIGFLQENNSEKTRYVATNDGGMYKDNDTWVSNNSTEIYLVNADSSGYEPFILIDTKYDSQINVTLWYRRLSLTMPVKNKRGRKKKNV